MTASSAKSAKGSGKARSTMKTTPLPNSPRAILILFTRYPLAGQVKTRLITALGAQGAADMHRRMTVYTLTQALGTGMPIQIRYTGGTLDQMRNWLGPDYDYVDQGNGDLGQRLERAFADGFTQGARFVVVVGCDCPDNRSANIRACFDLLDANPCVIGPAADGGYYMMGLNRHQPRLFHNIRWGTGEVLAQTMDAAGSFTRLETLSDVDEPQDLVPLISVIIPTLNESKNIGPCLQSALTGFNIECIVVDGGSTDTTVEIASRMGARVLKAPAGRAGQMNEGARKASGEFFLFIHGDSELPDQWDRHLQRVMQDRKTALGCFGFKIKEPFSGKRWIELGINLRSRLLGQPYGDQGLFVRRQTFINLGGYPEVPILEDLRFVQQAKKSGKLQHLPLALTTSGRRWKKLGIIRTTLLNQLILMAAALGADPHTLKKIYSNGGRLWDLVFTKNSGGA